METQHVNEADTMYPEIEKMMEPMEENIVCNQVHELLGVEDENVMMLVANDLVDHPELPTELSAMIDDDDGLCVIQCMEKYVQSYEFGDAARYEYSKTLFSYARNKAYAEVMVKNNILRIIFLVLSNETIEELEAKIMVRMLIMLQNHEHKVFYKRPELIKKVSLVLVQLLAHGFLTEGGHGLDDSDYVLFALLAFGSHPDLETAVNCLDLLTSQLQIIDGFDHIITYAEGLIAQMKNKIEESRKRKREGE